MAEYISRSYVRKMAMLEMAYTMETETDSAVVLRLIDDAPAADVAPVRHGWWLHSHYEDCSEHFEIVKCSNCDFEAYAMAFFVRGGNYCPNCGARMDGARNGEED